ncbi:methyl-accepting chemotaxis protein [Brevibacillus composti]|uniref:Methyl-accepting chemotaxis protein n=1 Tax=Brevibacillus composti TaxID=2796470 RepID=A0A7T5EMH0_9BACL|nr:methyl-accepting chemotaxis protein [Brevibacillus composti]QQE75341.1 methyl-accepting chemotaxis protein [Brevibacillus composti]QUO42367.1 methyl-accepting chemotaxis protein [Brevibacillus composti]
MLFGSIKTKIMLAIVLCSVLTVSLVGFASWYSSKQMIEEQMYQNAQYLVENKAKDLNNTIEKIESSVDYLSVAVLSMLDDVEKFKTDDGYIYSLQEKVRPIAENIAKETNGAMAFYVRFNPEYSAPTSGLFHADTDGDGTIEPLTPTDFSQYDPNDLEHVGWYYIPVKAGKPTWMDPYRNENIGVDMISYVIPLEKGGESIGVVGMDINFQLFTDVVGQIKPYEHSFAALLNSAQHYLIHPAYTAKENLSDVDAALFEQLGKSESGVIRLQKEANEIVSYAKLSNGFTLTVTSAEADVYHALNQLTGMLLVILGGVFLLALLIAFWTGNRLFRPLRRLVSDMEKVKDGDLTVRTPIQTRDEMALIGTQFNRMVEELGHLTKSIHLVSAEIKTSSEALAAFSEEVTASSEEMSASVEEIADANRQQSVSIDTCVRITSDLSHKFQELQDETGGGWWSVNWTE